MKKYLFVCQHNFTRSKYSAEFFRGFLKGRKKEGKVYSAGIGLSSFFLGRKVTKRLSKKMDWIFVMDKEMKEYFIEKFGIESKKIVVLDIEDIYGFLKRKTVDDLDKILQRKKFERYL